VQERESKGRRENAPAREKEIMGETESASGGDRMGETESALARKKAQARAHTRRSEQGSEGER